jgi:hypothetical protein
LDARVEFRADDLIIMVDGPVLEIFGSRVGGSTRLHRDQLAWRVWPLPGGGARVQVGVAAPRGPDPAVTLELGAADYVTFQDFLAYVGE